MLEKIGLYFNRYYYSDGQVYVKARLKECFKKRNIKLCCLEDNHSYMIFWDKDTLKAKDYELSGVRLLNSSSAIELCDNKALTYLHLAKENPNIKLINTKFAPLCFLEQTLPDWQFLNKVEKSFGYPVIAKHNVGSLGSAVFLLNDRVELDNFFVKNATVPCMYQECLKPSGIDYRIYTVGKNAIAGMMRKNEKSFVSNVEAGGKATLIDLNFKDYKILASLAEEIATALNLNYGAIDFCFCNKTNQFYFLEANSNAYFKAIEKLGKDIAEQLVNYICSII